MTLDEIESKRERAMALADQLPAGKARTWAFFWLGGVVMERAPVSLQLLDLILEGRLTFDEAMRGDVQRQTISSFDA